MSTDKQWIPHTPGKCPIKRDTIVVAELEDGYMLSPMRADAIDWDCPGDDVTRFRIVT